jgi:YHS domain-containing protein
MMQIVTRVPVRYLQKKYSLEVMRECINYEGQYILDPYTRAIGCIADPIVQGKNYRVYDGCPRDSYIAVKMDDDYSYENDDVIRAFRSAFNREPMRDEIPLFVGPDGYERLVVLSESDYNKWAQNQMNINPEIGLLVQLARVCPYMILFGPDGIHAKVVLNPNSTTTAFCSNCNKLHIIHVPKVKDPVTGKMVESNRIIERKDRKLHFCSQKCRSEYKHRYGLASIDLRELGWENW